MLWIYDSLRLLVVGVSIILMTRRSFGRKQLLEQMRIQKEEKQPRFEWIQNLVGDFNKTVEKPIELRETIMKNSQLQRCLNHNIIFSIYCTICRKILCASCMYSNLLHRKHRVIPIESATQEIREDLKTFEAKIPRIMQQSEGIMSTNSDFLVQMERDYNPILLKIQEFYESLRQLIKKQEKEQINYLKERRQAIRNEISAYNKELGRINQYITQKYKSYSNNNIKIELLIPSRNILQNLLAATPFIQESSLDLEKLRFSVDVNKVTVLQEDIAFKISHLLPVFEEHLPSGKGRTRSEKSLGREGSLQKSIGKKADKVSLEKKRLGSSIAGGVRTNRKF